MSKDRDFCACSAFVCYPSGWTRMSDRGTQAARVAEELRERLVAVTSSSNHQLFSAVLTAANPY